jgi:hypothetical protein
MKVKTQVKAGQLGIAVIGQASGSGDNTNSGKIGVLNIL